MARTPLQIEEALIESVLSNQPQFDVTKGPGRGAFVQPHAGLISQVESSLDDLGLRYSLAYVTNLNNSTILDLYCNNHGLVRGDGRQAQVPGVYFTYTLPQDGVPVYIRAGSSVSTVDGTVAYQTKDSITVTRDQMQALFNQTTKRYEIPVTLYSIGVGSQYEVGAKRLRKLDEPIDGIVGFDHSVGSTTSLPVEDNASYGRRQQAKLVGTAIGTPAGLESLIRDFDPARVLDVATVYSTELSLFKRPTRKPSFDIYVLGQDPTQYTDTFVARGGETEFVLTKQPINTVSSVLLDSASVDPASVFVRDIKPGTANSTIAQDKVKFLSPVAAGTTVTVTYTYNKLLNDVQEFISLSNNGYWRSNILVRGTIMVPIAVGVTVTALSSFDYDRIGSLLVSSLSSAINTNTMGVTYIPDIVRSAIVTTVAGLSKITIDRFQRLDSKGVIPVDTIEAAKNECCYLSPSDIVINIKTGTG